MMRYILYTTKILKILDKKTKIYLSFQIINLFFLAILETIGLGILAIYVGFLSNKSMILERIPNIIREHLINMPYEKIFFQVFPDLDESQFNWTKKQNEYENWDSFSHLHLITMIEENFKITITDDDAINLHSAKDLLDFVERNR